MLLSLAFAWYAFGPLLAAALACAAAMYHLVVRPLAVDHGCLRGKIVLVTGADSGFGRAIALRLHALGASVYAGVVTDAAAAAYADERSARLVAVRCDVTDEVAAVVASIEASGQPLWALVNNAGVSAYGWCEALPLSRYLANVEVNYLGTVRLTKACLPLLRRARGRIVNVGSIGAKTAAGFGSAYLSTKAAMCVFSECVRQEVHRFGVQVSYIEPGFFATSLLANAAANGGAESADAAAVGYPSFAAKMAATAEPVRRLEQLNGGARGLATVANAVVDALCSRLPRARYTLGWDARLLRYVVCHLPSTLLVWAQTVQDCGTSGLVRVITGGSAA